MDVEDAEADVVLARLRAALQAVQEPMVGWVMTPARQGACRPVCFMVVPRLDAGLWRTCSPCVRRARSHSSQLRGSFRAGRETAYSRHGARRASGGLRSQTVWFLSPGDKRARAGGVTIA